MDERKHHSSCGVGFVASRRNEATHRILRAALGALRCVEHRGACAADGVSGDGAGVMTEIPFDVIGHEPGSTAVATLFLSRDPERKARALDAFTTTFRVLDVRTIGQREVPVDIDFVGPIARQSMPDILQVFLERPKAVRTDEAFARLLYSAKQLTRSRLKDADVWKDLFFASLSTRTLVYKGLCRADDLDRLYPDLVDERFRTRFALYHRRFSTNTRSTWDKAQPFRLIGHNGEINTITGNRSTSYSREQAMGLPIDELLTHHDISDSGNLNEMVEALRYRSSIPALDEVLSIMIPPADQRSGFYRFWGRALEPWDGPALIAYADGGTIGARLDRNGFRPARWCMTDDLFLVSSEAGVHDVKASEIVAKGTLRAGSGATVDLDSGRVDFTDPSLQGRNAGAIFDARLQPIDALLSRSEDAAERADYLGRQALFGCTAEEVARVLKPLVEEGKEPIGSMGDTARPALFSDLPVSFYDYFYQRFAQVTNPPLDYVREAVVTDLDTYLGVRPNALDPKELLPAERGISLSRPVLSIAEYDVLRTLEDGPAEVGVRSAALDMTFDGASGTLAQSLARIAEEAVDLVRGGVSILLLSHARTSAERLPIPSLLALRAVVCNLNRFGVRLRSSVVLDAGDARTTHQVACAIGFGATAVCPRLALEYARGHGTEDLDADEREGRVLDALAQGLLKIMAKMGISVVRSYQSSKLFSALGLGPELMERYFDGVESPLGGLEIDDLERAVRGNHARALALDAGEPLPSPYRLKEKVKGDEGEKHSMTAARAKVVHDLVRGRERGRTEAEILEEYEALGADAAPTAPRHLLDLRAAPEALPLDEVEPRTAITRRFGSGAMSFGAISAESQRDLFRAMRAVGGRSNSGEGGENPYYYLDGTTATTKQIASGRFGVTAEYLTAGDEIEIKIAQGAKPGEGGQLMGIKVDVDIARARHATPGVDLISPPPQHDIYSIEDLKELIHELGELAPEAAICVKLVSGVGVGPIAVGVAKTGADVIQISGGDGGTGAAPLGSMRHAGLPFELGLVEAHDALVEHGLRDRVRLRVDGGLSVAKDIVLAALLGADEFGFGKLLLVAEGCIMARICEKNRCPVGIATHDPRFKAKYKGEVGHVVRLLETLGDGVRELLAEIGARSIQEIVGQRHHLVPAARFSALVEARRIDLRALLRPVPYASEGLRPRRTSRSVLNGRILDEVVPAIERGERVELSYRIRNVDRAVPAGLSGVLAGRSRAERLAGLDGETPDFDPHTLPAGTVRLSFEGNAGQGFAAFLVGGVDIHLEGAANDSVAKAMSGGEVTIVPPRDAHFTREDNVIIGNCALYGATGGELFVAGRAGDRFGVRNSGARSVVEGTGMHCCEYMTGGVVVVLGGVSHNVGAGMTGGVLYLDRDQVDWLNRDSVQPAEIDDADRAVLGELLERHASRTGSATARALLDAPETWNDRLVRVEPKGAAIEIGDEVLRPRSRPREGSGPVAPRSKAAERGAQ